MNIISQNFNNYLRLSPEIQRFNLTHTANYMISVQYILLCLILYFVFVLFCSLFSVCLFVRFCFILWGWGYFCGVFLCGFFDCFCLFVFFGCCFFCLFCFVLFFYLIINKEQRYVQAKNNKVSMNHIYSKAWYDDSICMSIPQPSLKRPMESCETEQIVLLWKAEINSASNSAADYTLRLPTYGCIYHKK